MFNGAESGERYLMIQQHDVFVFRTVIMGSRGPKISSFMIAESSGTSSSSVGAILLQHDEEGILWKL